MESVGIKNNVVSVIGRINLSLTAVIMPIVPSAPIAMSAIAYPVLSFSGLAKLDSTFPLASTISIPATLRLVMPNAQTRIPPALVATNPPTVALSRAARSTAKSQPLARTSFCK